MRDMKCGKRKATLIGSLIPSGAQSTRSFSWFVFAAPALFFNPWFLVIIALKGVISEGNQMRKSLGCYIFIRLGMDGFFFLCGFHVRKRGWNTRASFVAVDVLENHRDYCEDIER